MSVDQLKYVRRDDGKGKIHVAVEHDGQRYSNERCNLDQITRENRVVEDQLPPDCDREMLCDRCFPRTPEE